MSNKIDDRNHAESRAAAVALLKAMANEHRLDILCVLSEGEVCVSDLCLRLSLSQSAMSQHLAWLRNERLVICRRNAQSMFYRLGDDRAREVITLLNRLYGHISNEVH